MTQQPDLYQRFLTQPAHRERGRVVAPLPLLSAEERARAEDERAIVEFQTACPMFTRREAQKMLNHLEFNRYLRDTRLIAQGAFTALVLSIVAGQWLGMGT